MIAIVLLLLALAVGIAAVLLAQTDAGYVLIAYRSWSAETTLAVLVLGVVLVVLAVHAAAYLVTSLLRLPRALRESISRRRRDRARRSFESGLLHLLEGDWKNAELDLLRHAADRGAPQLNYLAAARAAQRLGAGERRDHYLQLAVENADDDDLRMAVLTTRAELQRERGEHAAVIETTGELRRLNADNPYAIELLAEALAAQNRWPELRTLLSEPAAAGLDPAQRGPLRQRTLLALLRAAAGSLDELKRLWESAGELHDHPALRLAYIRGLAGLGADAEALALAKQALDAGWDGELANLYGRLEGPDPLAQLAAAEHWLQRYGERAELLEAAGRACLRHRLWGKAESYLEALLRLAPSPRAHFDLAQLAEQTQRPQDAARHFREGLQLATTIPHMAVLSSTLPPPTHPE